MDRSRLKLADLANEALAGFVQRPVRSALTMIGTILGVGTFVAVLGLTSTASGQIDRRFSELAATQVTVEDIGGSNDADNAVSFPPDASSKIEALNGVRHAGLWWTIPSDKLKITAIPGVDGPAGLSITAIDPSALAATHPRLRSGRIYDAFHESRAERVAVLGSVAAERLGITRIDSFPAVFIDGTPYTVVGIVDDVARMNDLLFSVLIPTSTARAVYGEPTINRPNMLVEVQVGAANLVRQQCALALRPDSPGRFRVSTTADARVLQQTIAGDLGELFLVLAGISLLIGAVGITNTTLVAVMERIPEIGLRRTLGARPLHIAVQFLTESTVLGLVGGLIGSSIGIAAVVLISISRDWTAILASWSVLGAPPVGAIVGLFAGLYPALRASRIEPVEALRR
ncbi:ABC transporter permease [Actinoplanes sp. NPDC051411]|uniref:ABC transporter permease n=1 Tax=Actinoplanes sp. NPDC051411 TaxID=3155522 RepID=UPI003424227A